MNHGMRRVLASILAASTILLMPTATDVSEQEPAETGVRAANPRVTSAFIANAGQFPSGETRFLMDLGDLQVAFGSSSIVLWFSGGLGPRKTSETWGDPWPQPNSPMRTSFVGAAPVIPVGRDPADHFVNYLLGNNPETWKTRVPSYRTIVYSALYEGIDLTYRATEEGIKYEFLVSPMADPRTVEIHFEGIDSLELDAQGALLVRTRMGVLRDSPPVAYQDGQAVSCPFDLRSAESVGFRCAGWNRQLPLLIDPLIYATFLGGAGNDFGHSIAVDETGSAYVTGWSAASNFPVSASAYDTVQNGGSDVFVVKLTPDGRRLEYATYIGGVGQDVGWSIAVDSAGNAYVAGEARSFDFPSTPSAFQPSPSGETDAFVVKLNANGTSLLFATFLGGTGFDYALSIALGKNGIYVVGETGSRDFPTTPGAFQESYNGGSEAFVSLLSPGGNQLIWSTFLGGTDVDRGLFVAANPGGGVHVTGFTTSTDFPVRNAIDESANGLRDVFVASFGSDGSEISWSTYLGGDRWDVAFSMARAQDGSIYLAGLTNSSNFPTTPNAFSSSLGGESDAFLVRISGDGLTLLASTFFGGTAGDHARGIAVDSRGIVYLTGYTEMRGFPVTDDAVDPIPDGGIFDTFLSAFTPTTHDLLHSTFVGGQGDGELGRSIAVDAGGNVYLTGDVWSLDFPATPMAFQPSYGGTGDAFVAKFGPLEVGEIRIATSPPGLTVAVNGIRMATPYVFYCRLGSDHALGVPSPQLSDGAAFTFSHWSDSEAQTHSVACEGQAELTAFFSREYPWVALLVGVVSGVASLAVVLFLRRRRPKANQGTIRRQRRMPARHGKGILVP